MLNLLIAKTVSSQELMSKILTPDEYVRHNVREFEKSVKLPFTNYHDIDFIIADAKTILYDDSLYFQLVDMGLSPRLIVCGEIKEKNKLQIFLKGGIRCYINNSENAAE